MKEHTGKLFSVNVMGAVTWMVESTNVIGLIGAILGALAGLMLICIRWDDFMASRPVRVILEKIRHTR